MAVLRLSCAGCLTVLTGTDAQQVAQHLASLGALHLEYPSLGVHDLTSIIQATTLKGQHVLLTTLRTDLHLLQPLVDNLRAKDVLVTHIHAEGGTITGPDGKTYTPERVTATMKKSMTLKGKHTSPLSARMLGTDASGLHSIRGILCKEDNCNRTFKRTPRFGDHSDFDNDHDRDCCGE